MHFCTPSSGHCSKNSSGLFATSPQATTVCVYVCVWVCVYVCVCVRVCLCVLQVL